MYNLIKIPKQSYEADKIISILYLKKLQFREVKRRIQGHTAKNFSAQAYKLSDHTDFPNRHSSRKLFKMPAGDPLVIQWFILSAPSVGGGVVAQAWSVVRELRFYVLCSMPHPPQPLPKSK